MRSSRKAAVAILGLLLAGAGATAAVYASLPDPGALRTGNPGTTAFIRRKCSADCPLEWTPLAAISPFVGQAVVLAEDAGFYGHGAVSWGSLRRALQRNLHEGRIVWGGSTLTMQLARNLYLYPDRTLKRKLLEILLAVKLERALPKERILEIYLNVAEWAPDVFGITAASRHYFGRRPDELGPLEASFLASILPSPGRAGEPARRELFRGKGALVLDRLMRYHLPEGRVAVGEADACPEQLGEGEARLVDGALTALFARFGLAVSSGDAALLSLDEILAPLDDRQATFVRGLLSSLADGRPPLPCRRAREEADGELTAWERPAGSRTVRAWIPGPALPCLRSLTTAATADGVPLLLQSGYRAEGYQAYLILRELRLQGYCLSPVRRLMEAPGRSEHGCLDTTAVDFSAAEDAGEDFARTPAYRWLEENAPDFGFRLSYPRADPAGVGFEPWHWRFTGEAPPGSGDAGPACASAPGPEPPSGRPAASRR